MAAISRIEDEEGVEIDDRLVLADGTQRIVHSIGHRDAGRGYAGTIQDLTAVRGAELAARLAEERFRQSFDEAPIGMALIAPDGRIDQANAAFAELCGQLRRIITRLGVDYAQGYHIGRPFPISTLLATLPGPDPGEDVRTTRPAGSAPAA